MSKLISIITPIHNEQPNVLPMYEALIEIFKLVPNYDFEIIFVNDGSTDDSRFAIEELIGRDSRIKYIEFSRNFGKEIATTAGIHESAGDAVIMIDADLQHPPELIPRFIEKWERGAEVVVGLRAINTKEGFLKKFGSKLFYSILGLISDTKITPNATDYRLIDRQVVDQFNKFSEHDRITRGLIDWLGFDQEYIEFIANARNAGEASYNTLKLFKLAFSSFISHSLFPLRLAGYLGVIIVLFSGPLGVFILFEKYIFNDPWGLNFTGSATLGVMILFLVGIILCCLGLVALYIANINKEVTNRPMYVTRVRRIYEHPNVKLEGLKEPEKWRSRSADRRDLESFGSKT